MMLRIKKQHLGKIIAKGVTTITLSKDMSQKQIIWVSKMISPEFVEEYKPRKNRNKKKEDAKDNER